MNRILALGVILFLFPPNVGLAEKLGAPPPRYVEVQRLVTPSDTAILASPALGFYAAKAGTVTVRCKDGRVLTIQIPDMSTHIAGECGIVQLFKTGTTAFGVSLIYRVK